MSTVYIVTLAPKDGKGIGNVIAVSQGEGAALPSFNSLANSPEQFKRRLNNR